LFCFCICKKITIFNLTTDLKQPIDSNKTKNLKLKRIKKPLITISPLLISLRLGMDEFTIFFLMTSNTTLLLKISLHVHVYILLQCWKILWVVMGHMCNVNTCIMSCKYLCLVAHGRVHSWLHVELGWSSAFVVAL
jgi:hypothetical protein